MKDLIQDFDNLSSKTEDINSETSIHDDTTELPIGKTKILSDEIQKLNVLKLQFQNIHGEFISIRTKLSPTKIENQEFEEIYEKLFGSKLTAREYKTLIIDLKSKKWVDFLEAIRFRILPDIQSINIFNINRKYYKLIGDC